MSLHRAVVIACAAVVAACGGASPSRSLVPKSPHAAHGARAVTQPQPIARVALPEPVAVAKRAAFQTNLLKAARRNDARRQIVFTGAQSQLALMTIPRGGGLGIDSHPNAEEILMIASGRGKAVIEGVESALEPGDVIVVEPGARHDIVNTGSEPLRMVTVLAPPQSADAHVRAKAARSVARHGKAPASR